MTKIHHLLDIDSLSLPQIEWLFKESDLYAKHFFSEKSTESNHLKPLQNQTIALLFFEPSTRTQCSFEIAAKNLGASVLNINLEHSSLNKGETTLDTIKNLEAMGVTTFVIRHKQDYFCHELISHLNPHTRIINAGTGVSDHPSQALLDAFTIKKTYSDFESLKIAIIGDIKHSRVAHSNIQLLKKLNCQDIRIIAPQEFYSNAFDCYQIHYYENMNQGIENVDIIMMLRIQKERLVDSIFPEPTEYFKKFGLDKAKLRLAKNNAIIMHPGPINRGVEIDSDLADGDQSVILQQVQNGIFVRMAILAS